MNDTLRVEIAIELGTWAKIRVFMARASAAHCGRARQRTYVRHFDWFNTRQGDTVFVPYRFVGSTRALRRPTLEAAAILAHVFHSDAMHERGQDYKAYKGCAVDAVH